MSISGETNGKNEDHHEEEGDRNWVVRLVAEPELAASGRATPTGIHLALLGPEVSGMSARELGRLWGWSDEDLDAMIAGGVHLVAVVTTASPNVGRATAQALAGLIHGLRPDEAVHGSVDDFIEATQITPEEAEQVGLRDAQRALTRVFGLHDGAFGSGVILDAREDEDEEIHGPAFVIDEKIDEDAEGGPLDGGTSLRLEDYPEIPAVVRLPWDGEEGEE